LSGRFGVSNDMPEIYLHLDGQQAGPYQLAQVRQLLSEGKATPETLAWYQGLAEWTPLAKVLAAFSAEQPPVPPPAPAPATPQAPAKKPMSGCLIAAIIVGVIAVIGLVMLPCLAGIALGPITNGIKKAKESAEMQQTRAINLAMFSYANDNNQMYPDGKTSTEVFQKLIDGGYFTDPSIFYIAGTPGKTKPTSNKLTAENVCFDVTSGVGPDAPEDLPVVFSTGYNVTYAPNAPATRDPAGQTPFPGMAVAYKSNMSRFINEVPNNGVPVIPANFNPGTKTYRQLKP
jgi:type II secretory pathway pseudopilin PulG